MNINSWKTRARKLKSEVRALYLAIKDPRTPWYVKLVGALVIGYALSPIDLIPDFIPVVGYLDDLIIVPAGIALLLKMIPKEVLEDCRAKAQTQAASKKRSWIAGIIIVMIWLLAIYITLRLLW